MRTCFSYPCRLVCASAAIVLGVLCAVSADQVGTKDALKRAYDDNSEKREQLISGETPAKKGDEKFATALANYYIHRISHSAEKPEIMQSQFNAVIARLQKAPKNSRAFVDMVGPALVTSMKEVLANNSIKGDPTVVVNAAMMLPTMAKLQQENISAYLVELIQDEKGTHDAVRIYALKALGETMPIWIQQENDPTAPKFEDFADAQQNARRKHDTRNVDALVKFIERPVKVEKLRPDEIDVLRYFRREAIASLARAQAPAVNALLKPKTQAGLVAPTLMKVLVNDLQPPPTLSEKVEAALGLCVMKYPNMPEYNPDLAHYLIGQTLLEFTFEYNKDLTNFAVAGPKKQLPYIPWKGDANRFKAALKEMKENARGASAKASAEQLELKLIPILNSISNYKNPDRDRYQDLIEYVQKIEAHAKDRKVFKNLKVPPISEIQKVAP